MNTTKYEVVQRYIKSASYNILILEIPKKEINDKLTFFTREKGLIPKSLFDDFLIANCITNINDFLGHINQKKSSLEELNKIRHEVIKNIIEVNEGFNPENLVINDNYVVKVKDGSDKSRILLTENEFWSKDIYEEGALVDAENKKLDKSKIKSVKDLKYTIVKKFWRRIGHYINIKQFEPGSGEIILNERTFNTRSAFEQYVVIVCVDEVEDVFTRLDSLGLPQRVSSPTLIHELFELCRDSNPFLDFNLYKDNGVEDPLEIMDDPFASFQQSAKVGLGDGVPSTTKKLKLFKHVKEEALLKLGDGIKKRILGQDKAVSDIVDAVQRASVGLKSVEQPIGSFLFTGPTGVGKTYSAKILAEELIGNRNGLVTIDCSEYSSDHEYAKLIGSPAGYVGWEQGGYLTNAIQKNPFSIVLFDEIEKASDKVHQLLLQIMDEARLTDGKGKPISFKDTIVIMTSNLGVDEVKDIEKTIGFGDTNKVTSDKRIKAVEKALKKAFKPEFLNRINSVVHFQILSKQNFLDIIKLELEKLKINLKLNKTKYSKLNIHFDKSLYNYIYKKGIDEKYGARPLKRSIENDISAPLARKLLSENIESNSSIKISVTKKDKLKIDVKKSKKEKLIYTNNNSG